MLNEIGFIKFYNVFMEKGDYKLSPIQWYFYSLVACRWAPFLDATETSVSMLSNIQTYYNDKLSRNKENTLKHLIALKEKGVLNFDYDPLIDNYDKLITITFTDFIGHEQIKSSLYNRTHVPDELYFMCILHRFKDGFSHSMNNMKDLLDCNIKTVEKIISSMKEKKLIRYVQGKSVYTKSGKYEREPNTYFIRGIVEQDVPDVPEEITLLPDNLEDDIPIIEYGNWKDGSLNESDYILYAQQMENPEFMKVAESKKDRITSNKTNEKAMYVINEKIKEAIDTVERKRKLLIRDQKDKIVEEHGYFFIYDDESFGILEDNSEWYMFKDICINSYSKLDLDKEENADLKEYIIKRIKEFKKLNQEILRDIYKKFQELNSSESIEEVEPVRTHTYEGKKDNLDISAWI